MKKSKSPWEDMLTMKDPDQIFDLVCSGNYFAGSFRQNIPVLESRKCFDHIKKLLEVKKGKRK